MLLCQLATAQEYLVLVGFHALVIRFDGLYDRHKRTALRIILKRVFAERFVYKLFANR
jgi:hypothetical protein